MVWGQNRKLTHHILIHTQGAKGGNRMWGEVINHQRLSNQRTFSIKAVPPQSAIKSSEQLETNRSNT